MNKFYCFIFIICGLASFNGLDAYNASGQAKSPASQYYNGEISVDAYLDTFCPPKYTPPTTYKHSDGTWSQDKPTFNGHGVIYHSDGSWTKY